MLKHDISAHSPNTVPVRRLMPVLAKITLTALILMSIYEFTKQLVFPGITIWESHIMTIVFGSFLATVGAYVASHKLEGLHQQALKQLAERKRAEEELRFTQFAVDRAADCIYWMRPDARLFYVNDAACRALGYAREELLSLSVHDIDPNCPREVWPGFWEQLRRRQSFTIEAHHRTKHGHVFPVEITVNFLEFGGHEYNCSVVRDITERKLAVDAQRQNEARLKEAQRIGRLGNWEWDIVRSTLWWSDEIYRIFGIAPQQFGATYEAFLATVHGDDREFVKIAVARSLYARQPYSIDHRIVLRDGTERTVHEEAEVTFDEGGRPIRMAGTVQDITDRKQAEERIKKALAEKEILLKEIHHRVKNNLQVVSSLLTLQSHTLTGTDQTVLLQGCQDRIQSIALVHHHLYQSREMARVRCADYAETLVRALTETYGTSPNRITSTVDVQDVAVDVDTAVPLGLIMNELVSNALQHAFPGDRRGEIHLRLHTEHGRCRLIVCDNGVGLSPGIDVRTTKTLGLRLVQTLAEQLDGVVEIEGGKGTAVTISYPMKG